jgi:purine-binding chemotaxis protein CheW
MTTGDEVQLVTFRLGRQEFAFSIFQVERVLRYQSPDPLPKAPPFLEGILAQGDGVVPVVDLRKRLGLPAPVGDETRIVILDLEQGGVGVTVDAVLEVLRVPAERVAPPAPIVRGLAAEYISGIVRMGERTIVVLAPAKLLSSTERLALDQFMVEAGQ